MNVRNIMLSKSNLELANTSSTSSPGQDELVIGWASGGIGFVDGWVWLYVVRQEFDILPQKEHIGISISFVDLLECRTAFLRDWSTQ